MRHYNRMIQIISLMAILVIFAGTAGAQDTEDPMEIPILVVGDVVNGVFEEGVYMHLYRFSGVATQTVTIAMNRMNYDTLDPFLVLLGPSGEVVAVDDDGGSAVGNALLQNIELPQDGTYLVMATFSSYVLLGGAAMETDVLAGDKVLDPMVYELIFNSATRLATEDPAPSPLDALELATGESRGIETNADTPTAYILFEATSGDIATIETRANGTDVVDTMLYLFTPNGHCMAFNDDGAGIAPYSQIAEIELTEDGMYLILATSYQFYNALQSDWDSGGAFHLSIR